jgi:hypothetical protein
MNPFTKALLTQINNPSLVEFIENWDLLEALVIRVFKNKSITRADEAEHQRLRDWLRKNYLLWQPALLSYWPKALVAGELAQEDPFAFLLAVQEASDFVNNWAAMQTLPAAREALNRYLVDTG